MGLANLESRVLNAEAALKIVCYYLNIYLCMWGNG